MMRLPWLAVVVAASVMLAGCGKKTQRDDQQPIEETESGEPVDLDAVDSLKLGSAPCGNPDWSQLPPGSPAEASAAPKD